jgi:hypothetical protein
MRASKLMSKILFDRTKCRTGSKCQPERHRGYKRSAVPSTNPFLRKVLGSSFLLSIPTLQAHANIIESLPTLATIETLVGKQVSNYSRWELTKTNQEKNSDVGDPLER